MLCHPVGVPAPINTTSRGFTPACVLTALSGLSSIFSLLPLKRVVPSGYKIIACLWSYQAFGLLLSAFIFFYPFIQQVAQLLGVHRHVGYIEMFLRTTDALVKVAN